MSDSTDDRVRYSNEQFDKNIIFISSGSLAISFAFVKDLIPNLKGALNKDYLICSWYIFSIVIFVSLIGHYLSSQGNQWAQRNEFLDDISYNKGVKKWNIVIKALNISMIILILIGALYLINFIKTNLIS